MDIFAGKVDTKFLNQEPLFLKWMYAFKCCVEKDEVNAWPATPICKILYFVKCLFSVNMNYFPLSIRCF